MSGAALTDAPVPAPVGRGGDGGTLMAILERAVTAPDFDLARISQLLDLKERWDKAEAKKAFAAAKVAFKENPPLLEKDKHVRFTNRAGTVTEYDHATHYEVTSKISAALAAHGLGFAWSMAQADNRITVTCTLMHVAGHEEAVSLYSVSDDSGGKNSIQAIASATSYLQRYTLLAVTGMSVADMPDDDGAHADTLRPELPADVWVVLGDAARESAANLGLAWRALSDTTRATIVLHYGAEWLALKARATDADSAKRAL